MSEQPTLDEQRLGALPAVRQVPEDVALMVAASGNSLTPTVVEIVRDTVGKGLNPGQLRLFLALCDAHKVSPLTGAYAFPQGAGIAFGLKIDGMRALARRKANYTRKLDLLYRPGSTTGEVIGAWCEIEREGDRAPFRSEVLLKEFSKGGNWDVMPEAMIKKVAESHALRAAFPDALGGIYEPAELDKE